MYVLCIWGGEFYKCLLTCSGSKFKSWIYLLIFCIVDLSNIDNVILKSPTNIEWVFKSLYKSLRTCLMYLGAPV